MATYSHSTAQNSSQRAVAMALSLVSAVVLSPLYVSRKTDHYHHYDTIWSSGFVLPMVLAGLIIAIKMTSSSTTMQRGSEATFFPKPEPSWMLRIGGSSWGLGGILIMLVVVLSWQDSVQHFFWR